MAKKAPDRRVARTRQLLHDAFLALILEKGWDDVSVQDLCARANVGRSTFYLHFVDKEELLVEQLGHLRGWLRAQHKANAPGEALGFSRGLFEHAAEQRRMFAAVVGRKSGAAIQRKFMQLVLELIREDLSQVAGKSRAGLVEPVSRYVMGAFMELLAWWIESRNTLSVDEIDTLFRRMTRPAMAEILGR